MGIKITPADSWFSKCVRARANWCCERCHKQYDASSTGLHNSHYHGRGNWSVRFDKENCEALCYSCHMYVTANPHEHHKRCLQKLGGGSYDLLNERKNDIGLAKEYRRTKGKGSIATHFKLEYEKLLKERETGTTKNLDFENYL